MSNLEQFRADVTLNGAQTLTNKTVTGLKETRVAVAASAIDLNAGNWFTKTAGSALTWTVTNVPSAATTACFILELTNGGAYTQTWPTGTKWAGGIAPTLTAAGVDILGFYSHDAGTTWRGLMISKDNK
jgi:hypothetical protein